MKSKDLKIGEEYAFAAPNSYDARHPQRVRVVQIGVYGNSPQDSYHSSRSKHPNFIEFEPVGTTYYTNRFRVNLDAEGKICHGRRNEATVSKAYRGPAVNFLKLWSEHAEQEKQDDAARKRWDQREQARKETRAAVVDQFKALGFLGLSDYDTDVRFTVEQAQEILKLIEAAQ